MAVAARHLAEGAPGAWTAWRSPRAPSCGRRSRHRAGCSSRAPGRVRRGSCGSCCTRDCCFRACSHASRCAHCLMALQTILVAFLRREEGCGLLAVDAVRPPPPSACFLPGPWQASHWQAGEGVRCRRGLACLVLKMANTGNSPPSTWHIRQVSAPFSEYSVPMLGGGAGGLGRLGGRVGRRAAARVSRDGADARPDNSSSAANTGFLIFIVVCPFAMVLVIFAITSRRGPPGRQRPLPGPWHMKQISVVNAAGRTEKLPPLPAPAYAPLLSRYRGRTSIPPRWARSSGCRSDRSPKRRAGRGPPGSHWPWAHPRSPSADRNCRRGRPSSR